MKSLHRIRLDLVLLFFGCIIFCGVGVWSQSYKATKSEQAWNKRKAEMRTDNVGLRNYTSGIEVLSTEIDKPHETVTITFKNNYKLPITGYQVSIGGGVVLTDYLTGADMDQIIRPGEVRKDTYALQLDLDQRGIAILAVVLDDRSADGVSESVRDLKEYRKGVKIQRKYALHLMSNILTQTESEPAAALNDLESKLSPFSEEEEARYPPHVRFGLQDEKARLLRNIGGLKEIASVGQVQGGRNKKLFLDRLASLIESYTKTLDTL